MSCWNQHSLSSLHFYVWPKLNSSRIIKTFIFIVLMYGNFVEKPFCVAANKNLVLVTPHVATDSNILAISNFKRNYFNRNQITFDTLQLRGHNADDNDLLSPSIANCSRTSNCGRKSCDKNISTLTRATNKNENKSNKRTTTKSATALANTDITATTSTNMTKNVSSSSFLSSGKSSASSSASLSWLSTSLQQQRLLSRPKRYLSFPEGSSFSVAVCFTVGIIGNPRYNYMSFGLNWGVAYDLPNTTWILNHLHGFAKQPIPVAVWQRRSKRSLFKEIENVVDNMGYNGRECILRALCESRQYFQKTKMGMIGEMLRVIFSLPKQRIFTRELNENSDIKLYDGAYRKARSIADCSEQYECGFSLLELAFGKYSTPPEGYYAKHF